MRECCFLGLARGPASRSEGLDVEDIAGCVARKMGRVADGTCGLTVTSATSAPTSLITSFPLVPTSASSLPTNFITSLINGTSSSNTYPVVTTTGIQIVPSPASDASSSTGSSPSFPIAAIAIIAIVCGLVFIVVAYKTYVWWYRRRRIQEVVHTYPAARPTISTVMPNRLSTSLSGNMREAEGGFGSIWAQNAGKRSSSMMFLSEQGWATGAARGEKDEKEALYAGDGSEGWSPVLGGSISRESSPFGNGSMSSTNHAGLPSSVPSRQSLLLLSSNNRSSSSHQLRSVASSTRLNGPPHAPHSHIDIIPPLPLAPPPGTVVATDKSTLEFSALSGIGGGVGVDEWGMISRGRSDGDLAAAGIRSAGMGGGKRGRPDDDRFTSPSQSPSSSSHLALPNFSNSSSPTYDRQSQGGRPGRETRSQRARRANGEDGTEMEAFESGSGTGSTSGSEPSRERRR